MIMLGGHKSVAAATIAAPDPLLACRRRIVLVVLRSSCGGSSSSCCSLLPVIVVFTFALFRRHCWRYYTYNHNLRNNYLLPFFQLSRSTRSSTKYCGKGDLAALVISWSCNILIPSWSRSLVRTIGTRGHRSLSVVQSIQLQYGAFQYHLTLSHCTTFDVPSGVGRLVCSAKDLGCLGRRVVACRLWTGMVGGLGSACVAFIAAQRGMERCVVPSTLWCRWNTPLPLVDGARHGDS